MVVFGVYWTWRQEVLFSAFFFMRIGACPLVLQELVLCVSHFARVVGELCAADPSKEVPKKHNPRLLDEAGSRPTSSTQDQKTRTISTSSISPRGSSPEKIGDGINTVSESTVSDIKLSEFVDPHRAAEVELSQFLSAYLYAKASSPNSSSLLQTSASSFFRNNTLETVFHPFPKEAETL